MDSNQLKKTLAGLSVATLLAGACLASPASAASG